MLSETKKHSSTSSTVTRKLAPISTAGLSKLQETKKSNGNQISKSHYNSSSTSSIRSKTKNRKKTQQIYYAPENNNSTDPLSTSLNSLKLNSRQPSTEPSYSDTVYGFFSVEKDHKSKRSTSTKQKTPRGTNPTRRDRSTSQSSTNAIFSEKSNRNFNKTSASNTTQQTANGSYSLKIRATENHPQCLKKTSY